jgi:NitT/TauT family transport system substrate-binding protein
MRTRVTRRAALTIVAGAGASMAAGRAWADTPSGRVIYPVAIPVYQSQFVADRAGFFKDAGLDCKLIQGGSGVKTREIIASSQGDIGIGDITHPMQLSNHGRSARVLMPVDTRSNAAIFIIRKDLFDQGITTLDALAKWKRPDGRKPIVAVSSLGGTNHVWASYYMETMGLDDKVTWIGTGNVDTMMGTLKTKQVDVLINSPSILKDSVEQGWGALLFDGTDEAVWAKYIGGKVPDVSFHAAGDHRQGPAEDAGVRHGAVARHPVDQGALSRRDLRYDRALRRKHVARCEYFRQRRHEEGHRLRRHHRCRQLRARSEGLVS